LTTPEEILNQLVFDEEGIGWAEGGLEQVVKWGHDAPTSGNVAEYALVLGAVAVQMSEMGCDAVAKDVVEVLEMLGPHLKAGAVESNSKQREAIATDVGKLFDTKQPSMAPRVAGPAGPNVKGKVKRGLS